MKFSLFYFGCDTETGDEDKYELLSRGAEFADANGLEAVWTPERHLGKLGGLYPSPIVSSATIAARTTRIKVRAGSVVLPLGNPVRIAEDWAMLDQLSGGRTGIALATGWHPDDFILAPTAYLSRRDSLVRDIPTLRALWAGERVELPNGLNEKISVAIRPLPLQTTIPLWITSTSSADTPRLAGELGTGLLTALISQDMDGLRASIATYRGAWLRARHEGRPTVTVMLHSFLARSTVEAREVASGPLTAYLKSALDTVTSGRPGRSLKISASARVRLLAHSLTRYFDQNSLIGSVIDCVGVALRLQAIGVDELACMIDFGVPTESVLKSLELLAVVRDQVAADSPAPHGPRLREHR